ncbi:MAG: hypothetical protein ACFFD4_03400 [Candidatus Odinarchaeota archaeon]
MDEKEWTRRFTVEKHRAAEYVEVYEMLGEEVKVESCVPDEKEACQVCFAKECDNYVTIFTRLKHNSNSNSKEENNK